MRRLLPLFVSLALSACAQVEVPDFSVYVTLPASEDGYSITTVSKVERRIPKVKWDEMRKRGLILLSDDWAKLKFTLLKNCIANPCQQAVGTLDELFYAIDSALKAIPRK